MNNNLCTDMKTFSKSTLLLAFILSATSLAHAQSNPADTIDSQAQRFEERVRQLQKEVETSEYKTLDAEAEEEVVDRVESATFILNSVRISGSTIFNEEDFAPLYDFFIGQNVDYNDLVDVVGAVKGLYDAQGYLTTTVLIPEQDIMNGNVELEVIEGKLGKVNIQGSQWTSEKLIRRHLYGLKEGELLNIQELYKGVNRLNQNVDRQVRGVLEKGDRPETSNVNIIVEDKRPHHIGVSFDNQGTNTVGRDRALLYYSGSNVTGVDDALFLSVLGARNSEAIFASYKRPIINNRFKLGIDASKFQLALGKRLEALNLIGHSETYKIYLSTLWKNTQSFDGAVKFGVDLKRSERREFGTKTAQYRATIPNAELDLTYKGNGRITTFVPSVHWGVEDVLDSDKINESSGGREKTGSRFFIYKQSLTHTQRAPLKTYVSIRSSAQWAAQTLPSSEQFQIGGANSVRGYPEGDFSADSGGYVGVDWVIPVRKVFLENNYPNSFKVSFWDSLEFSLFYDYGLGALKTQYTSETGNKRLRSYGAGIRFRAFNDSYVKFEWAQHLGDDPEIGSGESSFHFYIQSNIW